MVTSKIFHTSEIRRKHITFNHEKSLMFKYIRMESNFLSQLVCGSHGSYVARLYVAWVSSHRWTGFFSAFSSFNVVMIVAPCSISFGFLAGPVGIVK